MLINNDILIPEDFVLDLSNREITISRCNTKIQILMKPSSRFISKRVFVTKYFVISFWTDTLIEIILAIFSNRDFIFFNCKF